MPEKTKKRHVYLDMKTREKALDIILSTFKDSPKPGSCKLPTPDAVGRILSEPVFAEASSPSYNAAAMDGIAVKASNTFGTSPASPKDLKIGEQAFYVNTGHQLPWGTDAVIMIEDVFEKDNDLVEIMSAAYPWQHVRKVGEDIVATQMLFGQNHFVTPACMGALLTGGIFSVKVKEKPKVLIIPTGDELVDWQKVFPEELAAGKVLETNSWTLGKMVESAGGEYFRNEVLPDDFFVIRQFLELAAKSGKYQMILVLAGSSAGSRDHTRDVIENLGKVLVHGVTIMPGKPVVMGKVEGLPVFGVPGYPVSAIVIFEEFIRPVLLNMLGQVSEGAKTIKVRPTKKIPSKLGMEDLIRVKLGKVGDNVVATPLARGAGSITTFTEADGIIRIKNDSEGVRPDETVKAELLKPAHFIENTIVAVGSHDNCLDILADAITAYDPALKLSSAHVGSMGGLMAIKNRLCHVAGTHLLDENDGTYNKSYIKKYLPGIPVYLMHLVGRDQGFMVAAGNPKNIKGVKDLCRDGLVFINRQSGSGTRILLDYELNKAGINPQDIMGYDNAEFTHMNVAATVKSGAADAGLGILAAANALGLSFIPLVTEQYEIIIPREFYSLKKVQALISIIKDPSFQEKILSMGGYHTENTGNVVELQGG